MKNKKKVIYFLKFAITFIILLLIFKRINFHTLIPIFRKLTILSVTIVVSISIIKLFFQIVNWKRYLLISSHYRAKNKIEIIKSLFIGYALSFLLPGGHAIYGKMYYLNNSKKDTFISINIERFIQTWGNFLFATFSAVFFFEQINVLITITIMSIIALIPFAVFLLSRIGFLKSYRKYFAKYMKYLPRILLFQILNIFLTITQYFIILRIFSKITFFKTIISVPLVQIANSIPISFNGIGLRELFAMKIFSDFNISYEIAVTTSLIIFTINVILPALLGVYFMISEKK